MSRRFYIETTSHGKQQFVKLKRSRSHGHHKHHHHHHDHHDTYDHHHHDDTVYYKVSVEEWSRIKERERIFEANQQTLVAENNTLRTNLSAAQADNHRLEHVEIPSLRVQVHTLSDDNSSLRRSVDNATDLASKQSAEIERLNSRVDKLTRENKESEDEAINLREKIRILKRDIESGCSRRASDLFKDVDYWKDKAGHWKVRFEDLQSRYEGLKGTLDRRTDTMKIYEDILRRNRMI